MLKTKARFRCKETVLELQDCLIEKVIRLNSDDFLCFQRNLCKDQDFIIENNDIGGSDEQGNKRCLLILNRDSDDGILVNTEGYNYARYTAYIPGAKYFVEACQEKQSMKFYCPLTAETYEQMDDDEYEYAKEGNRVDPEAYEEYIRDTIIEYDRFDDERGLALYLKKELQDKVWSIRPGVEMCGDSLYGVFHVEITEELSPQELENLRKYVCGQASDGWGEGFEQREIKTHDGEIYVHFWDSGDDYFMLTDQEFEVRMNGQTQETMSEESSIGKWFQDKLFENFETLKAEWVQLPTLEIIKRASEIAVTEQVYDCLQAGGWDAEYEKSLLRFKNPLEVVRDQFFAIQRDGGTPVMQHILDNIFDNMDLDFKYELNENYSPPDQLRGIEL